jgi:hypothetical protein
MKDSPGIDLTFYDHLIDAEREALARSGKKVDKIQLIKALRGATGLGLAQAKQSVDGYLARRGGIDRSGSGHDRPTGWIDDLLDAERAAASKDDRSINKIVLIKALREASGLRLKPAKDAVEDYLRRKGGEDLPTGSNGWKGIPIVITLAILIIFYVIMSHSK